MKNTRNHWIIRQNKYFRAKRRRVFQYKKRCRRGDNALARSKAEGIAEGIIIGKAEGRAEGKAETVNEMLKNMRSLKLPEDIINKIIGRGNDLV